MASQKLWFLFFLIVITTFFITPNTNACPECGCWEQWLQLQQRSYLESFSLLPKKEKILTVCDYQLFLTSVQVLPETFELLIYAQNPQTRKPYLKPKNISIYKQTSSGLFPVLNTIDNDVVSEIRYVNPQPASYLVRITLENESGPPLIGETYFILGSPSPNLVYLVTLGGLIIFIFIFVIYSRHRAKSK